MVIIKAAGDMVTTLIHDLVTTIIHDGKVQIDWGAVSLSACTRAMVILWVRAQAYRTGHDDPRKYG